MYDSKIQKPQRPIPFYNNTAKTIKTKKQDMYGSNIQKPQKTHSRNLKNPYCLLQTTDEIFCNFYFYFSHKLKPSHVW